MVGKSERSFTSISLSSGGRRAVQSRVESANFQLLFTDGESTLSLPPARDDKSAFSLMNKQYVAVHQLRDHHLFDTHAAERAEHMHESRTIENYYLRCKIEQVFASMCAHRI